MQDYPVDEDESWRPFSDFMIGFCLTFLTIQNAVLKTQLDEMTRLYEDAMRRLEKYEPATKKAKLQL